MTNQVVTNIHLICFLSSENMSTDDAWLLKAAAAAAAASSQGRFTHSKHYNDDFVSRILDKITEYDICPSIFIDVWKLKWHVWFCKWYETQLNGFVFQINMLVTFTIYNVKRFKWDISATACFNKMSVALGSGEDWPKDVHCSWSSAVGRYVYLEWETYRVLHGW